MIRRDNFSETFGIVPEAPVHSKEPGQIQKREQDLVLDLVFAPDKKTGLPSSDIAVYLSGKTPPQVRDFIKSQIFGDGLSKPDSFSDVGDDVLHELVRGSNETVDEYSSRLSRFMVNERLRVDQAFVNYRNAQRMVKFK